MKTYITILLGTLTLAKSCLVNAAGTQAHQKTMGLLHRETAGMSLAPSNHLASSAAITTCPPTYADAQKKLAEVTKSIAGQDLSTIAFNAQNSLAHGIAVFAYLQQTTNTVHLHTAGEIGATQCDISFCDGRTQPMTLPTNVINREDFLKKFALPESRIYQHLDTLCYTFNTVPSANNSPLAGVHSVVATVPHTDHTGNKIFIKIHPLNPQCYWCRFNRTAPTKERVRVVSSTLTTPLLRQTYCSVAVHQNSHTTNAADTSNPEIYDHAAAILRDELRARYQGF